MTEKKSAINYELLNAYQAVLTEINFLIRSFQESHRGKRPHFVYIGIKEMQLLQYTTEFRMQNTFLTPSKPWTIFGVEIVEVNKETFLEVGEKNEIR